MKHRLGDITEALTCHHALDIARFSVVLRLPEACRVWAKKALDLRPEGRMLPVIAVKISGTFPSGHPCTALTTPSPLAAGAFLKYCRGQSFVDADAGEKASWLLSLLPNAEGRVFVSGYYQYEGEPLNAAPFRWVTALGTLTKIQ